MASIATNTAVIPPKAIRLCITNHSEKASIAAVSRATRKGNRLRTSRYPTGMMATPGIAEASRIVVTSLPPIRKIRDIQWA